MRDERPGSGRRGDQPRPNGPGTSGNGERAGKRRAEDAACETGTVRTNDIETYYERRGEGPPVVFVHAALMDHSMWEPQVERLGEEYTTIAYDVRGHGRTGGSDANPYSVDLYAEDLDALLATLDIEHPVLCGASLGGEIAQVYASTHPDGVAGLVLADTWTPEIRSRLEWFQMRVVMRATIPLVRLFGYRRVAHVANWFQERIGGKGARGDYEKVEQLMEDAPAIGTREFAKIVRSLVAFYGTDVDYAAITAPTLILYGENTMSAVKAHVPHLAAGIPNSVVREVPGGGHANNLDNPEFFSTAIGEFLADHVFDPPEGADEPGDATGR